MTAPKQPSHSISKDSANSSLAVSKGENMDTEQSAPQPELTFGEKAVGLRFNPSEDTNVAKIKRQYADIIDTLHRLREATDPSQSEVTRMLSVAITESQTAQMWAVKAVTWSN